MAVEVDEKVIIRFEADMLALRRDMAKLTKEAKRTSDNASASFSSISKSIVGLTASVSGLVLAMNDFLKTTDELKLVNSRLKLATSSTDEFAKAQKELYKIAQDSRQEFGATADLYSRMSRATKDLGISQSELFKVTETVNKALQVSGATTQEAQSAITQLGQGLASGVLRGEEFNSIMENGNRIAQAMATSLGVNLGQLRAMAQEGKLTSEVVINALTEQAETVNTEFEKMAVTSSQSWMVLRNSIQQVEGDIEMVLGANDALSEMVLDLSKQLEANSGNISQFINNFALEVKAVAEAFTAAVYFMAHGVFDGLPNIFIYAWNKVVETINSAMDALRGKGIDNLLPDPIETVEYVNIFGDALENSYVEIGKTIDKLILDNQKSGKDLLKDLKDWQLAVEGFNDEPLWNEETAKTAKKVTQEITDDSKKAFDAINDSLDATNTGIIDFGQNLEGIPKAINAVAVSFQQLSKISQDYNKTLEEIGSNDKLTGQQQMQLALKAEQKQVEANYGAYANLAGAMANMYEQGSAEALGFQVAQATLGIASSYTAIANAWALPFPANLGAVAMVASAVMPVIQTLGSMGGSSGSGGGGGSAPSASALYAEGYKNSIQPITDRLDKQIEILSKLGDVGGDSLNSASLSIVNGLGDFVDAVANSKDFMGDVLIGDYKALADKGIESNKGFFGTTTSYEDVLSGYGLGEYNLKQGWKENTIEYLNRIGGAIAELESDLGDSSSTIDNLATDIGASMVDVADNLLSAVSTLGELSQELLGNEWFDEQTLAQATEAVRGVYSGELSPDALGSWLQGIVSQFDINLAEIKNALTFGDAEMKADAITQMVEAFGLAGDATTQEVLSLVESFGIVGDSLISLREESETTANNMKEAIEELADSRRDASETLSKYIAEQNKALDDFYSSKLMGSNSIGFGAIANELGFGLDANAETISNAIQSASIAQIQALSNLGVITKEQADLILQVRNTGEKNSSNTKAIERNTRPRSGAHTDFIADYRKRKSAQYTYDRYADQYSGFSFEDLQGISGIEEIIGDAMSSHNAYISGYSAYGTTIDQLAEAFGLDTSVYRDLYNTNVDDGTSTGWYQFKRYNNTLKQMFEDLTGEEWTGSFELFTNAMETLGLDTEELADTLQDVTQSLSTSLHGTLSTFEGIASSSRSFADSMFANNAGYSGGLYKSYLQESKDLASVISGGDYTQDDVDALNKSLQNTYKYANSYFSAFSGNASQLAFEKAVAGNQALAFEDLAVTQDAKIRDVVDKLDALLNTNQQVVTIQQQLLEAQQQIVLLGSNQ